MPPSMAQKQVFGYSSQRDMSDYTTAAYNYLMKQQEQAYNLDLWNLMNQYNSPASQMQRFQDAGLNPNLIYSQQNQVSSPQAASAVSFRPQNTHQKQVANGIQAAQQVLNSVKTARETYDYLTYGRSQRAVDLLSTQESAITKSLQNEWSRLLLEGPGNDENSRQYMLGQGPRYQSFLQEYQRVGKQIKQIGALIAHYAKTDERFDKLMELDDQRLGQMQGQYDFILHGFDTGNETFNAFLRMLMMFGLNSGF